MPEKQLVLIVEDDMTLQFLARKQLSLIGLACHTASNGREAVEMVSNGYDLILMDISMPVMDGIEATSHIREQELKAGKTRTPIIGLTAFKEREKCLAAGMDDFIQKPLLLEQLLAIVKKFLNYAG